MQISRLSSALLKVSLCLLGWLGLLYVPAYLTFVFHLPFGRLTLVAWMVVLLAPLLLWGIRGRPLTKPAAGAVFVSLMLAVLSIGLAASVYDTSFDGQGYHIMAVAGIADGWNPLYQPDYSYSMWVNNYPKAGWMAAASLYKLTGWMEAGKAVNLIALLAALAASLAVCLRIMTGAGGAAGKRGQERIPVWVRVVPAVLLACCAALNPIVTTQLFTYYNDGLIASLLLVLISVLFYYVGSREERGSCLAAAVIAVILLVNLKFTAIAYAGLICFWFIAALAVLQPAGDQLRIRGWSRLVQGWKAPAVRRPLLILLSAGICGMLLLGWNPYVVNTVKHGHPFYPLAGKGAVDIMTGNSPANFIGLNRVKGMLVSLASRSEDAIKPNISHHADLWPIPWKEFNNVTADTRVAGFGPFSPAILSGATLLCGTLLLLRWRTGWRAVLVTALLMSTVLINPEPWWARYVPQLWLAPLFLAAAAWLSRQMLLRVLAGLLLLVCLVNAGGVLGVRWQAQFANSNLAAQQYRNLAGQELILYPQGFLSPEIRLQEHGIAYRIAGEDEEASCAAPEPFLFTLAYYCKSPGE